VERPAQERTEEAQEVCRTCTSSAMRFIRAGRYESPLLLGEERKTCAGCYRKEPEAKEVSGRAEDVLDRKELEVKALDVKLAQY
jgi:hypothetical protein